VVFRVTPSKGRAEFACPAHKLALINIDWQKDFLAAGGFGSSVGNDVSVLAPAVAPASRVLAAARHAQVCVAHTLEAHDPSLDDLSDAKKLQAPAIGTVAENGAADVMGRRLVRGEPGNAIVDEMQALDGEVVVHKPGKSAFYETSLHAEFHKRGISHLVFTGVTTEVCVQTTARAAADRGFMCLIVDDATASYNPTFHEVAIEMMTSQNAIVASAASSDAVVAAFEAMSKAT